MEVIILTLESNIKTVKCTCHKQNKVMTSVFLSTSTYAYD
jgi:hypothetical protein